MNALDTNIWIYAHDRRDPAKQAIALNLIESVSDLVLPWQVGCEFLSATRKLEQQGFSRRHARQSLHDMQQMAKTILLPTPDNWLRAADVEDRFGLSLWDALLVAACAIGGVTTLYSEDFGTLSNIDDVRLVNPFAERVDTDRTA